MMNVNNVSNYVGEIGRLLQTETRMHDSEWHICAIENGFPFRQTARPCFTDTTGYWSLYRSNDLITDDLEVDLTTTQLE